MDSEVLAELVDVEILSGELELEDALHVDGLLALLFELELHVVLLHSLDGLARQLTCCLLKVSNVHRCWVAEQANDVRASDKDDTLLLGLESLSVGGKGSDVDGRVLLFSSHEVGLLLSVFEQRSHLEVQDLLVLLLSLGSKAFILVEESRCSRFNLALVNTPGLSELVENVELGVHDLNGTLLSNVVESYDTIRNSLRLKDTDPANFGGVVGVGAAACLSVNASNVDHSQRIAWHYTTLVERETVLFLSLCLIHETFGD